MYDAQLSSSGVGNILACFLHLVHHSVKPRLSIDIQNIIIPPLHRCSIIRPGRVWWDTERYNSQWDISGIQMIKEKSCSHSTDSMQSRNGTLTSQISQAFSNHLICQLARRSVGELGGCLRLQNKKRLSSEKDFKGDDETKEEGSRY